MVKECEQVFELFDFDKETYPELYSALNGARKAELDFHLNIDKNLKKTKKTALDERHIEDFFSLNPQKVKDGEYDARIIKYFRKMIQMVQKEAIKQYAPLLQEKWLKIAYHRATKGHISRDVDVAINMVKQYAAMRNIELDNSIIEDIDAIHKKSIEDYANKNMNLIARYASKIMKQRTSEERYEKLEYYIKKLSEESRTNFWQSQSYLPKTQDEFKNISEYLPAEKKK
jgi:hypothetical protein